MLEDYFSEGLRVGILAGVETQGAISEQCVLEMIYQSELFQPDNISPSNQSNMLERRYELERNRLERDFGIQKQLDDLWLYHMGYFGACSETYLFEGMNLGLILGLDAASIYERRKNQ